MELMKRDFLTVTDDGDDICMTLDTVHSIKPCRRSVGRWLKSGAGF